jgi:hypothetical protein
MGKPSTLQLVIEYSLASLADLVVVGACFFNHQGLGFPSSVADVRHPNAGRFCQLVSADREDWRPGCSSITRGMRRALTRAGSHFPPHGGRPLVAQAAGGNRWRPASYRPASTAADSSFQGDRVPARNDNRAIPPALPIDRTTLRHREESGASRSSNDQWQGRL